MATSNLLHFPLPFVFLLLSAFATGRGDAAAASNGGGGGQLWCVAKNNAEDAALQAALDWACSPSGGADCRAIQQGGACYDPPDLQAHASFAFNDYFLRSGAANPAACDFSGAAALTSLNPSHGSCVFPSSSSSKNGNFTGATTYGPTSADLSRSSPLQLTAWSCLLSISLSVLLSVVTYML